jgi:hypothetical protein
MNVAVTLNMHKWYMSYAVMLRLLVHMYEATHGWQ